MAPPIKNLVGQRFGFLTVIKLAEKDHRNLVVWECVCDCGNTTIVLGGTLKNGGTKSCGCYRIALVKSRTRRKIHGHCVKGKFSGTYETWKGIKERCQNRKHVQFRNYGGRGIRLCERWQSFEGFLSDMGERPLAHSIDRIDNDGNYEPGNCRWATDDQQRINKRTTFRVMYCGEVRPLAEVTAALGVNHARVYTRMRRLGWSLERAIVERPWGRDSA